MGSRGEIRTQPLTVDGQYEVADVVVAALVALQCLGAWSEPGSGEQGSEDLDCQTESESLEHAGVRVAAEPLQVRGTTVEGARVGDRVPGIVGQPAVRDRRTVTGGDPHFAARHNRRAHVQSERMIP